MSAPLTARQASILAHTASNGRYVSADAEVLDLAVAGLLYDHGAQRLAGGDHYLTITGRGVAALREWKSLQPQPPRAKRRSRVFDSWLAYCEACGRVSFSDFLKRATTSAPQPPAPRGGNLDGRAG